jgi:hypothetical protein
VNSSETAPQTENFDVSSQLLWPSPWRPVVDPNEVKALQRELKAEIGPRHPLFAAAPRVLGRSTANDEIVVELSEHRFAIVHLVWHTQVDRSPDAFPSTTIYDSLADLQCALNENQML